MERRKVRHAIRKVARNHGITEQEVVREIEIAIQAALEAASRENDHAALARWKGIPCCGEYPNAYELVDYLSDKLISNL